MRARRIPARTEVSVNRRELQADLDAFVHLDFWADCARTEIRALTMDHAALTENVSPPLTAMLSASVNLATQDQHVKQVTILLLF